MTNEKAPYPVGLSLDAARSRIVEIAQAYPLGIENIELAAALGRILAADVRAPRDVPGYRNSAMDGFAVRGCDLPGSGTKVFELCGEVLAGSNQSIAVGADECVRITTGASLPPGADTVVMKENTHTDGHHIAIDAGTRAGANVRAADEDFRAGDPALKRGTTLGPAHVAVLAAFGLDAISVAAKPRAVLLTTGDELIAPSGAPGPGQIYDSNRFSLGGLLEQRGVQLVRHQRLRDDSALLRDALLRANADADIVVTSGGVSVGEADFMPQLLEEIGEVYFWKVQIKPGMPILFGRVGKALVFALPGNPVSGFATFLAMVIPAIEAMSGVIGEAVHLRARLTRAVRKNHSRTEFQRARLTCDDQAVLRATPSDRQGSAMLSGLAQSDALIVLPETIHDFPIDTVVDVVPLPGWAR